MPPFSHKLRTMISVYYAMMLEYRAEILLWALSGLLPLMLMGVWMKAAASGAATGGLSPEDFARYFFTVFIVGQFTSVWVIWEFEYDIVEGRLSPFLLQPIDPVWRHVANHAGERLTRLPWVVGMIVVFFLLYPKAFWVPSPRSLALGITAIALAFTLRFVMQWAFAMLGFWVERASAIEQMTFVFYIFLSGRIAPLELYPEGVARAAEWTPFPYVVYFPTKLLLDPTFSPWRGFAIMLGWIAFFLVVQRVLWRRGLKHYSAMGA